MTTQDRLAAALDVDFADCWIDEAQPDGSTISTFDRGWLAAKVLDADPTLAQDFEDGQALRELRKLAPTYLLDVAESGSFDDEAGRAFRVRYLRREVTGSTIAEAVRAYRAALGARRG